MVIPFTLIFNGLYIIVQLLTILNIPIPLIISIFLIISNDFNYFYVKKNYCNINVILFIIIPIHLNHSIIT